MSLDSSLYEDGDDTIELQEKIVEALQSSEHPDKLAFFYAILKLLLPLLIRMFTGIK